MNKFWQKVAENGKGERNLAILGIGTVTIAIVLTIVNIWIYQTDGTIQLDLSRPGYEPENIEAEEERGTWSATGDLSRESVDEFLVIWDAENKRIRGDIFRAAPLSDESLGIRTEELEEE
ncbi:hypothetical protein FWH09_02960 [Candidatus Saccharibacteria bacterium]|nr:hypothetical protein [Candidatus Saccharibacteria bacterium]